LPGFSDLGLSSGVLAAIEALGFEHPTPVQAETIPAIVRGRDVIGQAQTGSGKTAAFGLPAIDHVDADQRDVQVLVLTPTRELAIQVAQALRTFSKDGVDVVAVFGGQPIREQTEQLKRGPQIAVGTPGRVMDLVRRGWLPLHSARYVVLDEADEMLSLGFLEDVEWILRKTPAGRQTLLFSATMPPPIKRLGERYLIEPEHIQVASKTLTVETIRQIVVDVEPKQKLDTLIALLERERPTAAIVFRKRKIGVDELHRQLRDRGVEVSALHGGMTQGQRDSVMLRFRAGRARILIATNVAARGLDISHVSHVISYDVPDDPEEYTHRIGRTGRVGRTGIAFTFAGKRDARGVADIERVTGASIEHIDGARIRDGVPGMPVEGPAPKPAPAPVEAAPQAEPAPQPAQPEQPKDEAGPQGVRLFVGAGRRHGVQREPLVQVFREQGGVEPLRARVHHAFSFVDVAPEEAEAVVERLAGAELGGRALKVQVAERQPAAA
jgi:ATP-dependent RNA helicase DeaD